VTYRVRNVPASYDCQTLTKQIQQIFDLPTDSAVHVKSLCPDPDDLDSHRLQIASVSFETKPSQLCGERDEWKFIFFAKAPSQSQTTDFLAFDTHFSVFTPLHSPALDEDHTFE
jgi:hypothetical protein